MFTDKQQYLQEQDWGFSPIPPLLSSQKCYLPHAPDTSCQKEKSFKVLLTIYIYTISQVG